MGTPGAFPNVATNLEVVRSEDLKDASSVLRANGDPRLKIVAEALEKFAERAERVRDQERASSGEMECAQDLADLYEASWNG